MTLIAILVKNVGSQNIQIWPSLRQVGSGAALMDLQIPKPLQCLQMFTNVYQQEKLHNAGHVNTLVAFFSCHS